MQCPGQDNRYWAGSEVFDSSCPKCGHKIEFFKDDSQRACKHCGYKALNPKIDFGCASYCQYAEQCLGSMPPEILAKQENLFKDRLTIEVKRQMISDDEGFNLVKKRADYGEILCKQENSDMAVILTSALLSKIENPQETLDKLKAKEELVDQVSTLLNRTGQQNNVDKDLSAVFHDACLLADIDSGNRIGVSLEEFQTTGGEEQGKQLLAEQETTN